MSTVETQVSQSESVRKHKEFLFPAVAMYYKEPLALVRGEGFHVWDDQNNKYLDCFGGVLTVSVGHNNPRVSEAIIKQVQSRTVNPSPSAADGVSRNVIQDPAARTTIRHGFDMIPVNSRFPPMAWPNKPT